MPAALKFTPVGSAPVKENVGAGAPVATTVNVPAVETVNVVALALVMLGAVDLFSVKTGSAAPELAELAQVMSP